MKKIKYKKFLEDRETVITSLLMLGCILLVIFFPADNIAQMITKNIFFLVILPVLYIKYILKKTLSDYGLNLKNAKDGILWSISMLVILLVISFVLIKKFNFSEKYVLNELVVVNFWAFIFYEMVFINILLFVEECFFRGFMLFTFERKIGFWSIFLQAVVSIILISASEGSFYQSLPGMMTAVTSGIIAAKSRSFFFSYLTAILFSIIFNSYIIHTIKF